MSERQAAARARMEKNKKIDKFIRKHPVWEIPDLDASQWGLTEDELFMFQEIFAIAEPDKLGYMGQRQFKDLLALLKITVTDEKLATMFQEMDENDDNQITFDEFVGAMSKNLDAEQIEMAAAVKPGACGTKRWTRGEIVWGANNGIAVVCVGMAVSLVWFFDFILVPLAMAYFLMFLVAPLMNSFEFRPLKCKGKEICDHPLQDDGNPVPWKPQDCLTKGMMPHALSVILTLVISFVTLFAIAYLVYGELSVMLNDDDFVNNLKDAVDDAYSSLNASGIKIIREEKEGYTPEEAAGFIGIFSNIANLAVLILLLWIYLIAEKFNPTVFDCRNPTLMEIENQAKNYIALKTILSFVTGLVVAIILLVLQVKLAVMWGLLSFVLNFIPNVGSMIAMFLPMPVVIVDPGLETWQKIGAFAGPGAVQGYVGNALEPMVFGKSLNMTPLAILAALVIWGSVWGLMGAILSVPLLGIQKILMQKTNHPIAKYCVMLIREDPTVDENALAAA
jgi:AI-2 transport protein TqsA